MSETYTTGGDTLIKCVTPNWQGEAFRPLQTHILQFIDLELKGVTRFHKPVLRVYLANNLGEPLGDPLSIDRYIVEANSNIFITGRCRYSMMPCTLYANQTYLLVVSKSDIPLAPSTYWLCDLGDATYPRGWRMSTANSGVTWTRHPYDDFIFAEFGDPPLPKPEPPPPITKFAIPTITYTHTETGLIIKLTTSVPCHLTCYYTDKQPLKHPTSRIIRGIRVPWGTYFCFVAWHTLEQNEPGDTLYHTFSFDDWHYCQTKWFTFRANIDFVDSESVGPIFKYHHPGFVTPELLVEEQLGYNFDWLMRRGTRYTDSYRFTGQRRLNITDRTLTHLQFYLRKWSQLGGTSVQDIFYQIRNWSDKSIIVSKKLCNWADLTYAMQFLELELDIPIYIENADIAIGIYYASSSLNAGIYAGALTTLKPDSIGYQFWYTQAWSITDWSTTYRYRYFEGRS